MGKPEIITVEPSELYREGNPFVATVVSTDGFDSVNVRIQPPCYLNEAAVKIAGENMAFPIIKHDRIITTQAATLISLFFSECKLPNGDEQTPECARQGMVDVITSLLDDLGRTESPLLFALGEK